MTSEFLIFEKLVKKKLLISLQTCISYFMEKCLKIENGFIHNMTESSYTILSEMMGNRLEKKFSTLCNLSVSAIQFIFNTVLPYLW